MTMQSYSSGSASSTHCVTCRMYLRLSFRGFVKSMSGCIEAKWQGPSYSTARASSRDGDEQPRVRFS
jgi:hypothetical protein